MSDKSARLWYIFTIYAIALDRGKKFHKNQKNIISKKTISLSTQNEYIAKMIIIIFF